MRGAAGSTRILTIRASRRCFFTLDNDHQLGRFRRDDHPLRGRRSLFRAAPEARHPLAAATVLASLPRGMSMSFVDTSTKRRSLFTPIETGEHNAWRAKSLIG